MAFDMYAGDMHEAIGNHEEFLFALIEENDVRFPVLLMIWADFYEDPRLSSAQANALIHELLNLLACNGGATNKVLSVIVLRLISFLSAAFRANREIRCASD
jgi:hypothetical protein